MLHHVILLAANPIKVTCAEIGNCSAKTPTIDVGLTNIMLTGIGIVGGLAMIFVIVSGLQMVLSSGNSKRVQMARESLFYSILGVVIAITAWGIVRFVSTAFSSS